MLPGSPGYVLYPSAQVPLRGNIVRSDMSNVLMFPVLIRLSFVTSTLVTSMTSLGPFMFV